MKTIHLANIACGFHASYVLDTFPPVSSINSLLNFHTMLHTVLRDFMIMDKTVLLAKGNGVHVGAHPSLPDHQVRLSFGRLVYAERKAGILGLWETGNGYRAGEPHEVDSYELKS